MLLELCVSFVLLSSERQRAVLCVLTAFVSTISWRLRLTWTSVAPCAQMTDLDLGSVVCKQCVGHKWPKMSQEKREAQKVDRTKLNALHLMHFV